MLKYSETSAWCEWATTTGLAESPRWTLLCGTPNTRLNARQNAASESHAFVLHYGVSEEQSVQSMALKEPNFRVARHPGQT